MTIICERSERYGEIALTTDSPKSRDGIPVLRVTRPDEWPHMGPLDRTP